MMSEIEQRILTLLRSDPEPMVPLSRIHAALVAELGPRSGTYAQLRERIRRRPDLFLLIEPIPTPWSDDSWPAELRGEYERALREAGLDAGPRVAIAGVDDGPLGLATPAPGAAPVLRALQASLVQLWAAAAGDPQLQPELVEALGQAEEVRRVLETHLAAHARAPAEPEDVDAG
jgi:hypothetical protein